jgi:hypothetical protein
MGKAAAKAMEEGAEQQPLAVAASAPSIEGGTYTDEEAEPSVEARRRPQLVWPIPLSPRHHCLQSCAPSPSRSVP